MKSVRVFYTSKTIYADQAEDLNVQVDEFLDEMNADAVSAHLATCNTRGDESFVLTLVYETRPEAP